MVDFSDVMPVKFDDVYHICPVCRNKFKLDDRKFCVRCARLCTQDREDGRFPPRLKEHKAQTNSI